MPSSRELAQRYGIHRNTAGNAYKILKERGWVDSRLGAKMVVADLSKAERSSRIEGLDELIDDFISTARRRGHTAQQLRLRVQDRLLQEPPEQVLVVSADAGLRQILDDELERSLTCPIQTCSPDELVANPGLAVGAVVVCAPGSVRWIRNALPELNPLLTLKLSSADDIVQKISALKKSSVIAVVSVSPIFVETARAVFAPVVGTRHELIDMAFREDNPPSLGAVDLAVCDALAHRTLKSRGVLYYQLASPAFVETLAVELGLQ